jgi:hypothetical protein
LITEVVTGGIVIVVVATEVVNLADPSTVVVHSTSRVVVKGGNVIAVADFRVLGGSTIIQGGSQ